MSTPSKIPDDVRRFLLTSVPTIPFLEATLLLRNEGGSAWTPAQLARRIYVSEARAAALLQEMEAAGIVTKDAAVAGGWGYRPPAPLAAMIDRVAAFHATDLQAVTDVVHSSLDRRAQQFADAFRWRKDH